MAGGKSLFHRFALKQKVALVRKTKAVKTLQDELERAANVRDQLEEMAGGMSVPEGETTIRHLRSASWYGNQVHEQLKTISNRAEFLSGRGCKPSPRCSQARHQHCALLNAARRMTRPASLLERPASRLLCRHADAAEL